MHHAIRTVAEFTSSLMGMNLINSGGIISSDRAGKPDRSSQSGRGWRYRQVKPCYRPPADGGLKALLAFTTPARTGNVDGNIAPGALNVRFSSRGAP